MSFDKMIEEFKDFSELQNYSEAQFKTITELTKKLTKLQDENIHLKAVLEQSTSVLLPRTDNGVTSLEVGTDQEIIAQVQLRLLKEQSYSRELTLEETRKVETYTKILTSMAAIKPKTFEVSAKDFGENDLLKLVSKNDKAE